MIMNRPNRNAAIRPALSSRDPVQNRRCRCGSGQFHRGNRIFPRYRPSGIPAALTRDRWHPSIILVRLERGLRQLRHLAQYHGRVALRRLHCHQQSNDRHRRLLIRGLGPKIFSHQRRVCVHRLKSPGTLHPRGYRRVYDYVAAWHAMLLIACQALEQANARCYPEGQIQVLINNSDGRGNSYGSHLQFLDFTPYLGQPLPSQVALLGLPGVVSGD